MSSEQQKADLLRLISWLQSARDRLMPNVTAIYGDAFDGDFDVMLEAINTFKRQAAALTQPKPAGDVGREVASALRAAYSERTTSQPEAEGVEVYIKPTTIALMTQAAHAGVLVSGEVFNQPSAETVRLYTATRQQQEAGRVDEAMVDAVCVALNVRFADTDRIYMLVDHEDVRAALTAALNPGSLGGGHG